MLTKCGLKTRICTIYFDIVYFETRPATLPRARLPGGIATAWAGCV